MNRLRQPASVLLSFALFASSTGVCAPSFASAPNSEGFSESAAVVKTSESASVAADSASAAERIHKAADALAKKRLAAYVISRYGDASKPARERFAANFKTASEADPSAEIHPYYLVSLERSIIEAPKLKEDGTLFGAYVHVLLTLRDSKADVTKLVLSRKKELSETLKRASVGKMPSKSDAERTAMFKTFAAIGYDPWSSADLAKMRETIEKRGIGTETPYFRAYAIARAELANGNGNLSLVRKIPHSKQEWNLSCEANSMRDLINYYRLGNNETAVSESALVFLFPSDPNPPKYENGVRIWADPAKTFVGRIDGRQSVNPNKLTGYGIHADGVLPYVRKELRQYGLRADKREFDSDLIRDSLANGHPVSFWYVLGTDPERGFARLDWNTPDGRRVTGYVGQHVGVIVGAKIGNDGKIEEVSYYEGRSSEIQKEPFESLSRKAKWFNEAIYVSTVEKSGTGAEKIKTRKKNVRTAVSRTIKKSG